MILKAGFDTFTGYGNDAVDMAVGFARAGVDLVVAPSSIRSGLPRQFLPLLAKDPGGRFDVALQFAPPAEILPGPLARMGRVAVGWTMWERTPLVREDFYKTGWTQVARRTHWWGRQGRSPADPRRRNWLDLMVVTCHDNVDAFRALDPHVPLAVVPNGVDTELFPVMDRSGADRPMVFASVGMLGGRKDPFATLQAWDLAQRMDPAFDALLVLKTSQPGLHPKLVERYRNVAVICEEWPRERLVEFYGEIDVLVSTSRGEGNNKPAMEFMSTGGAVMATDWGGHRNWLHPDWAYPLPGKLQPLKEDWPVSDFRVDVQATAETFLHCWRNPREVTRKGELAAEFVRSNLSWEKVIDRFLLQLGKVL